MKIFLASNSPRRKELLSRMDVEFTVLPSENEEKRKKDLPLTSQIKFLAKEKAENVFNRTEGQRIVIGADTMVSLDGEPLGKPKSKDEAIKTLKNLSGKTHEVITGLCVISNCGDKTKSYLTCIRTKVTFIKLSDEIITKYVETNDPLDKAGSYGIQGYAGMFIKSISGSYDSVVGLPTSKLYEILKKEGVMQ